MFIMFTITNLLNGVGAAFFQYLFLHYHLICKQLSATAVEFEQKVNRRIVYNALTIFGMTIQPYSFDNWGCQRFRNFDDL